MNIAFIPARKKSKGLPGKHMKIVGNAPVIEYTLQTAEDCAEIDLVAVISDDNDIRDYLNTRRWSKRAHFIEEPSVIAEDYSTDYQACLYTLARLGAMGIRPDNIVHLRASHILRDPFVVGRAVREFDTLHPDYDSLRSVNVSKESPYKMWLKKETGYGITIVPAMSHPTIKEPYNHQRQRLPLVYHQNGYVDITRYSTVMEKQSMTGDLVYPFFIELSGGEGEIDAPEDFARACRTMGERIPS